MQHFKKRSIVGLWSAVAAATVLIIAASPTVAATGARPPTKEERTTIEGKLTAGGFKDWKKIEFEEGLWKIDEAKHTDGKKYDLELDKATLEIVRQDPLQ